MLEELLERRPGLLFDLRLRGFNIRLFAALSMRQRVDAFGEVKHDRYADPLAKAVAQHRPAYHQGQLQPRVVLGMHQKLSLRAGGRRSLIRPLRVGWGKKLLQAKWAYARN